MAREAVKVRDYPDDLEALPQATTTGEVYDVDLVETPLLHHEIQVLESEVEKEKQAARDAASVEPKIRELQSKLDYEEYWDNTVALVEGKVTRNIPKPQKYESRMGEIKKLDEAQLKVYETELDNSRKAEVKKVEDHRVEPKKVEHKPNETKKV